MSGASRTAELSPAVAQRAANLNARLRRFCHDGLYTCSAATRMVHIRYSTLSINENLYINETVKRKDKVERGSALLGGVRMRTDVMILIL